MHFPILQKRRCASGSTGLHATAHPKVRIFSKIILVLFA